MSFQDLELGHPTFPSQGALKHNEHSPSRALAACIFRINTAVASYKRLVNNLGTPKDALDLRHKLHKSRLQIGQLVKETSAELDRVRKTDHFTGVEASKKVADAKLAKDYESVLKDFEKVQLFAAKKELAFAPPIPKRILQTSSTAGELERNSLNPEQTSLLIGESNRQVTHLESEITLNEAIIEEQEQGIKEIQQEISEVHEIFRDLALLISEQGTLIDDISSNVEGSHAATTQATFELAQASNIQKSCSSLACLVLVIIGIILLIVVFVVVV
ncbi:hypothetical protein BUALT_Bualt01G0090700 [Buddleja alternifolia]|uniref:t-SNARE coiled-coil homology domain-containing protein n=1 Tax=Buddleja alternifolia TaxID=168488 RepID=A0AAV6Y800_9LAMI|nr:hypothetical protein BUALT_Bualt01G0090700 [Buddleja alternifolia]